MREVNCLLNDSTMEEVASRWAELMKHGSEVELNNWLLTVRHKLQNRNVERDFKSTPFPANVCPDFQYRYGHGKHALQVCLTARSINMKMKLPIKPAISPIHSTLKPGSLVLVLNL